MSIPRTNNFDLVRLLAATQVVVGHMFTEMPRTTSAVLLPAVWWMGYFPGVPIFFAVSGFLIYWSFERNAAHIGDFFRNRCLRIYPGLWVCFAVTLALLAAFRQISPATLGRTDFWAWAGRQLTFFQFGTPDYFRGWGDGQVNRSLWTISIELQFYALVPLIYYLFQRLDDPAPCIKRLFLGRVPGWPLGWAVLFLGSIGIYELQCCLPEENILSKIRWVCITSCLYNFLYGIAFYKCWERNKSLFEGRCFYWLAAYAGFAFLYGSHYQLLPYSPAWNTPIDYLMYGCHYQLVPYSPDPVRMLGYFLLSGLTISAAFSCRTLSDRLLHGFDVSYGVYIYQGLILNTFLALGWMQRWELAILVLPASYALGAGSWVLVERPMLRKKKTPEREKGRKGEGPQLPLSPTRCAGTPPPHPLSPLRC